MGVTVARLLVGEGAIECCFHRGASVFFCQIAQSPPSKNRSILDARRIGQYGSEYFLIAH